MESHMETGYLQRNFKSIVEYVICNDHQVLNEECNQFLVVNSCPHDVDSDHCVCISKNIGNTKFKQTQFTL